MGFAIVADNIVRDTGAVYFQMARCCQTQAYAWAVRFFLCHSALASLVRTGSGT